MRRLGRWVALALLATSVTGAVEAPASADASYCHVAWAQGTIALRVDKPIDLPIDCDLSERDGPDDLQISVTAAPEHGTVGTPVWDPELRLHTVRYDPDDGYLGDDSFTITATDDSGPFEHVLALRMSPNRPPSCWPEGSPRDRVAFGHARVGEPVELPLLCEDVDEQDYWELDTDLKEAPAHGDVSLELVRVGHERRLRTVYTPDPGFTGSDSFVAGVFDGALGDHVTVEVNVADGPWCRPWQRVRIRAGSTSTFSPLCTQPDGSYPQLRVVDQPTQGVAELHGTAIRYRPDGDAAGPDSFTYQAYSPLSEGNIVAQAWDVLPDAAPVCTDRALATPRGEPVEVALACTDPDGDDHELAIDEQPDHGTLGELADGTLTYTPDEGFDGTDRFTYTSSDYARTSAPATVTLSVTEDEAPLLDVRVPDQTPTRAARRGVRLRVTTDEPVTVDLALLISSRLARRLDVPRRIGGVSELTVVDARRVRVDLTRRAARAIEPRTRLPITVDLTAADEWGNSVGVETRALLR